MSEALQNLHQCRRGVAEMHRKDVVGVGAVLQSEGRGTGKIFLGSHPAINMEKGFLSAGVLGLIFRRSPDDN